jgi:hypothetical protein
MTADPPWVVVVATLSLAAVSWWAPIRGMEAPWPATVGFYGGFFGAAIAGDAGHWLLAELGLAVAVVATGWLVARWSVVRRGGKSEDGPPRHRRSGRRGSEF